MLSSIREHIGESDVVLVVTGDNPADLPSRGCDCNTDPAKWRPRTANMRNAVRAREAGGNWASTPLKVWFLKAQILFFAAAMLTWAKS